MRRTIKQTLGRNLWDRKESRYIWFRMAVPKRYQHVAGKTKVQFSLETEDVQKAREIAKVWEGKLLSQWRTAAGEPSVAIQVPVEPSIRIRPRHDELEEAAVIVGRTLYLEDAEKSRKWLLTLGPAGQDLSRENAQGALAQQAITNAAGDFQRMALHADEVIEAMGWDLPQSSAGYRDLCTLIAKARFAAMQEELKRVDGDLEWETDSPLVQKVRAKEAATAKPGERIMELFEMWADECRRTGKKRPDTVTQDRKVVELFANFVGAERAINSITPVEVAEFRDTLKELPPKWNSKRELRDLPMREAAHRARELGLGRMQLPTVNKNLSTISPLYTWIAAQPRWAGLANPCRGLLYKGVKGQNPRPPFSTATLNRILKSPLFTGFARDGREHVTGSELADDWRKWILLICMFTGARVGEIAQLRVGDIRQERGYWFFWIRHDSSEGLSTKSARNRLAPMHSLLQRMGLLKFHKDQASKCDEKQDMLLFPELEPNSRGHSGAQPSEWWRDYIENIGVKSGADGQGTHSFRHTIADRLRTEAELMDLEIAVLLDHDQKTTTAGYGSVSQGSARKLHEWIEAVTFEGVDLSHLLLSDRDEAPSVARGTAAGVGS